MRNTVVSLFRCFEDKNPKKVNLFQILTTPKFKSRIETLRAEEDEEKQKELKKRLRLTYMTNKKKLKLKLVNKLEIS